MLSALEAQARDWGLDEIRVISSVAARAFYERHAYVPAGEPHPRTESYRITRM
jgi:hypothetical protein